MDRDDTVNPEEDPASDVSTSESDDAIQMLTEDGTVQDAFGSSDDAIGTSLDTNGDEPGVGDRMLSVFASDVSETSKAVTTDGEYSGIDIGTVVGVGSTMSQSSSNDTLSSVPVASSPDHNPTVGGTLHVAASQDRLSIRSEEIALEGIDVSEALQMGCVTEMSSSQTRDGDIGSLVDGDEVALVFLTRLLCHRFLLTGYQFGLVPDRRVRISVKSLALSCIGSIFDTYPKAFLQTMHKTSTEPGNTVWTIYQLTFYFLSLIKIHFHQYLIWLI